MFHTGSLFVFFVMIADAVYSFPKIYGEWTLWHSTMPNLPDNRVVIHIYPDNQLTLKYRFTKGPMVYHKSKKGTYKVLNENNENKKSRVEVLFHHTEENFLSVYGIGLQDLNIKTRSDNQESRHTFCMTTAGIDDIYLKSIVRNHECFHIVRSVRINEPSVDIPISTFLITQIFGTLLGHLINELVFHSDN